MKKWELAVRYLRVRAEYWYGLQKGHHQTGDGAAADRCGARGLALEQVASYIEREIGGLRRE